MSFRFDDSLSRVQRVQAVLAIVFALNLAVAAAKFFYGIASGSASMQADGLHSVFDSFGNVVALVGIVLASRPADKGHPYGHAKFETYGSVIIAALLFIAAFNVGTEAVGRLTSGVYTAEVTLFSFVVMLGTLAVNICVTVFERRQGKRLQSEILGADAAHTLSDVLVSLGVIVGLVFVKLGYPMADPIMALLVTVAIFFSGVSVLRSALDTLSDRARVPYDDVVAIAEGISGIEHVHCVRTRGTEAEVYCDLHVHVDPDMTVREAHSLGESVERAIMNAFPSVKEVLVHVEPSDDEVEFDPYRKGIGS